MAFRASVFLFAIAVPWGLLALPRSSAAPAAFNDSPAGASWTLGDFDGDGLADLLTSSIETLGPSGYGHRIQIRSGSGAAIGASFQVFGSTPGLTVLARDIDGDHDLDLIVSNSYSSRPIGVWINDGHGVFTQADEKAYDRSLWTWPGASFTTPVAAPRRSVSCVHERRPPAVVLAVSSSLSVPAAHGSPVSPRDIPRPRPMLGPFSPRAPPASGHSPKPL